ncbi:MAG: DNA alkylation repair protein [Nitrospira sp.]|nr:DNA alkylation repair protein [bacterium]MBL7049645.1 DNA alkylation repair protein [Nitrospira sp.]
MSLKEILADIKGLADPDRAKILSQFFKTGKGEYGEGDAFLGVGVPELRKISRRYSSLPLSALKAMLTSKTHEIRFTALLVLVMQYESSWENGKKERFDFYINHINYINNWDLVDLTADRIAGDYLSNKDRTLLFNMACSENLWERRISIIATFNFIKRGDYRDTLKLAEILLADGHDLIHKAVGWMLREIGNRDRSVEEKFLDKHHKRMPRTMLRYAIEKFDDEQRRAYMKR